MENQDNSNPSPLTQSLKSKRNSNIKWYLIVLMILAIIAGVYWYIDDKKINQAELDLSPSEVEQLEQSEQQRILNAQLKDLQKREATLTENSSKNERFVVYIQLAEVQGALGMNEEAIKSLDKIQSENLGNTRIWMTYAQIYRNIGNNVSARSSVERAMVIDDGIVDNWLFLFGILDDMPRDKQESIYQEALQKTENDPKIQSAYDAWKAQ